MLDAVKLMNSLGITSIIDMWAGEHEWRVYQSLAANEELTLRVVNALIDEGVFEKHTGEDFERVLAGRHEYETDLIHNDSIKLMVDGVFEGETGAVLEPYSSDEHLGVLNHTPKDLRRRVLRYYDMGLNIHFHTMGDRAARAALDALEYARERGTAGHENQRHSLSHLGLIDPADMPRFAAVNAAASFTPVWAGADDWTVNLEIPTLGRARVDRLYPIRSVQEAGAVVVGGSDWNYGALDPLLSLETAVTRQLADGEIVYRAATDEAIDLGSAIDAYTINGAWLTHSDDRVGSIEPGKLADIVILDRNLFTNPASEISDALIDLTIFAGRVVYERPPENTGR
jgi:predicted amidohydrolase YtcJ